MSEIIEYFKEYAKDDTHPFHLESLDCLFEIGLRDKRIKQLERELKKHGNHLIDPHGNICARLVHSDNKCSCGLDDLLAGFKND